MRHDDPSDLRLRLVHSQEGDVLLPDHVLHLGRAHRRPHRRHQSSGGSEPAQLVRPRALKRDPHALSEEIIGGVGGRDRGLGGLGLHLLPQLQRHGSSPVRGHDGGDRADDDVQVRGQASLGQESAGGDESITTPTLYPNMSAFLQVKTRLDPRGLFSNDWTDSRTQTLEPFCALEARCIRNQDLHCAPKAGYFCRPGLVYKEARVCPHVK